MINQIKVKYNYGVVARIDFDKNTDILLKANQKIKNKKSHIPIWCRKSYMLIIN